MGAVHTRKKDNNMNSNSKDSNSPSSGENASSRRPLSIEGPRYENDADRQSLQLMPNQPRQPTNLPGLLRFAMEAAQPEGVPHSSHVQPIDEERKQFLTQALNSMTVNIIEELQKAVKVLSNVVDLAPHDDPSEHELALERIADSVDNMDIANDFYKIGGFAIFGPCLNSPHSSIRWKAADIIAELTQNNPFCQERILEMGLMPILLSMVDTDDSEQARIKALYAVSCIVRGHPLSLRYMDINDGYSILFRAIQSPVEKLQVKSAFLLCALCNRDNAGSLRETLVRMGLIEQVAGLLTSGSLLPDTREQMLGILKGLTNDNYLAALRECRRPELCLKLTLERHYRETKAEESIDEAETCRCLLDRLFSDRDMGQER
ncbi:hsp70-binding protein 1 [Venturia canescens]|uniref:hsp70-binding protein 1 n=1 Tax=Venturia canescens TaxID=32260 RepID=UPI001C9D1196|nr:hsp70-binding protein 1 [Venturia canescens]